MFAAADDFADVLEANTGAPAVRGTLDDVYNPDKASKLCTRILSFVI